MSIREVRTVELGACEITAAKVRVSQQCVLGHERGEIAPFGPQTQKMPAAEIAR